MKLGSVEETLAFGRNLAADLEAGSVLALVGDLGAGKTHLSKGIVEGLGSASPVTSPTFTLVHEYGDGRLPVFHFDFYRPETPEELLAIGWEEYLEGEGVVLVEWADKFPELMPPNTEWWKLRRIGEAEREIQRQTDC